MVNQELDTQPKYLSKMKKEEFIRKKNQGMNLQQTYSTKNVKERLRQKEYNNQTETWIYTKKYRALEIGYMKVNSLP